MKAYDRKLRDTDVMNTEQILRLVQSIPSKKAEPFKLWLAQIGKERYVYKFTQEKGKEIIETLEQSSKWSKNRLDDDKLHDFKYNEEVLSIENGYYHYELVCRTSDENKKKNVTKENATGYEVAVYDYDKNILYYYWTSM